MKISFRIKKEVLITINNALMNNKVQLMIGHQLYTCPTSIIVEIADILEKKVFSASKTSTIVFYKHTADIFYLILGIILEVYELSIYDKVQINKLKDEVHQKKTALE